MLNGPAGDGTIESVLDGDRNLLFIEGPEEYLPSYDEQSISFTFIIFKYIISGDMLMFIKYFNAKTNELNIVGHVMMSYKRPLSLYLSKCRRLANLPEDTPLRFYEVE